MGLWGLHTYTLIEHFASSQQDSAHMGDVHKTAPPPYEIKFPERVEPVWTSIVVDESHRFLSGIRGAHAKTQIAEGLCRLNVDEEGLKVALSGTPIKGNPINFRSEEHTSELQSLMRISYAVFCLKKKTTRRSKHYIRAMYIKNPE